GGRAEHDPEPPERPDPQNRADRGVAGRIDLTGAGLVGGVARLVTRARHAGRLAAVLAFDGRTSTCRPIAGHPRWNTLDPVGAAPPATFSCSLSLGRRRHRPQPGTYARVFRIHR